MRNRYIMNVTTFLVRRNLFAWQFQQLGTRCGLTQSFETVIGRILYQNLSQYTYGPKSLYFKSGSVFFFCRFLSPSQILILSPQNRFIQNNTSSPLGQYLDPNTMTRLKTMNLYMYFYSLLIMKMDCNNRKKKDEREGRTFKINYWWYVMKLLILYTFILTKLTIWTGESGRSGVINNYWLHCNKYWFHLNSESKLQKNSTSYYSH